mmetsp:Transcript_42938/g.49792  ORF Transcript_42938/g.49792 Transcript_42938/m.49792 type:complete len:241 (+) Transcript_42938:34-756(+)
MNNYQAIAVEDPNPEDDRASTIESAASTDSNLIGINPDGTLMKATPAFKYKAKLEEEKKYNDQPPGPQMVYIIDNEEVIFVADANEIPAYFDDFVALYLKHQRNFIFYLGIAVISELVCGLLSYFERNDSLTELEALYPKASAAGLSNILNAIMIINGLFAICYYTLGGIAIMQRSSKLLGYFTSVSILGLLVEMILAYVDGFNFFIFLVRFVGLIYSRFINQILISLLLIPRVTQMNNS